MHISCDIPGHDRPNLSVYAKHKQVSESTWSTVGWKPKIDSTIEALLAKTREPLSDGYAFGPVHVRSRERCMSMGKLKAVYVQ